MPKQLPESKAIVLREKQSSEAERKAEIITKYVEDFAAIAGRDMTPRLYVLYIEALADLDVRQIEKGLKRFLQYGTKFPFPGELREWIEEEI